MIRAGIVLLVQMSAQCAVLAYGGVQATIPSSPSTATRPSPPELTAADTSGYVLGPDDVIGIKALDAEEITSPSIRIDPGGYISLPMLGRVTAVGLTIEELEEELSTRLKTYVKEPVVAVSIVEYRSQPVSVIGSVGQPGVHQLEGRKTLVEILAKAGGLRPEAANTIKITRKAEWGPIPLPSTVKDPSGQFSVAEVSLKSIMEASNPGENILIRPYDVISVPHAALVYVIGEVKKPGGFLLHERGTITGLQALAMAEGLTPMAASQRAMIIRQTSSDKRIEIPANLKEILGGKTGDVELRPDDIFFIPTNGTKRAFKKVLETAIQATTSAVIYRGVY